MKLSVLTATYDRAMLLEKLYESIKQNLKYKLNCEWIIVDDGSEDNTKQIVDKFINENVIPIKYCYQKNGGKMKAINEAVKYATGELIVDCDSDDFFTEDAFEIILEYSNKLLEDESLYGMIFLKKDEKGEIFGKEFQVEKSTMFDLYFKHDIQGEKIIVYNAKIRKQYFHELEDNEKFVTEARMYHKMDEKYSLICVNKVVQIGSYIESGYTRNINETFKNAPKGYYMYFKEILEKDMKGVIFSKRLYAIKHYILFGYLTNQGFDISIIKNLNNKILYTLLYIPRNIKK